MHHQSKKASLAEALLNTVVGFAYSFLIQITLNAVYGVTMSNSTSAWFVFWFTVASIVRSYVIRRIMNNEVWLTWRVAKKARRFNCETIRSK